MLSKIVRILGSQVLDVKYYVKHVITHNLLGTEDTYNNEGSSARIIAYALHPQDTNAA